MGKEMILGESDANKEVFQADNKTIFYVKRGEPKELASLIYERFADAQKVHKSARN